jgi:hypothetical protein
MTSNQLIYENLCREMGVEEWSEVKQFMNSDNIKQVLEAATAFKDAALASKKAGEDYDNHIQQSQGILNTNQECWEERTRLRGERNYAYRIHDQKHHQLMMVLYGEDDDPNYVDEPECIVS